MNDPKRTESLEARVSEVEGRISMFAFRAGEAIGAHDGARKEVAALRKSVNEAVLDLFRAVELIGDRVAALEKKQPSEK